MILETIEVTSGLLAIPDPPPAAPGELASKVNTVLAMVKWASLMVVLGILFAAGLLTLAADRGYGGGISPELKSKGMAAIVALVIVGSGSQIVEWMQ